MSNEPRAITDFPEVLPIKGGAFALDGKHNITVRDFHIGKYLVTNAQYGLFLQQYDSIKVKSGEFEEREMFYEDDWGVQKVEGIWQAAKGFEDHPAIYVNWYGAVEYCKWLSGATGYNYRLPSEAEWEYAASGGPKSKGFLYAGGHKLKEVGWYSKNSHGQTKPVGLKQPNELGLYDMSGNVWEWCADHWHDNYDGVPKDGSAWVASGDTTRRVVRGGSWDLSTGICRVSYRLRGYADSRYSIIGFRVARY